MFKNGEITYGLQLLKLNNREIITKIHYKLRIMLK